MDTFQRLYQHADELRYQVTLLQHCLANASDSEQVQIQKSIFKLRDELCLVRDKLITHWIAQLDQAKKTYRGEQEQCV